MAQTAVFLLSLLTACVIAASEATAQVHERDDGRYVLRANVTRADNVAPEVLERHQLPGGTDHALLNVVVLERGATPRKTVPAVVTARIRDAIGHTREITLRAVVENGRVSYLGTVPILSAYTGMDFHITARPTAAAPLTLQFSERLSSLSR